MSSFTSFEELDCYKKCRLVRQWIYNIIIINKSIDRDLIQNIRRAGRFTTRNIAEGFGRHHHKENMQFCRIALGSLHEILEDINILHDESLASEADVTSGRELIYQALKSTQGYVKYLNSRL